MLGIAVYLAACGGSNDSTSPQSPTVARLINQVPSAANVLSGDSIVFRVRAFDAAGLRVPSASIEFTPSAGVVSPASNVVADTAGYATVTWRPGTSFMGAATVTAHAIGTEVVSSLNATISPSLAGTWTGSTSTVSMTLHLDHRPPTVSGSGQGIAIGTGQLFIANAVGNADGPHVSLTFSGAVSGSSFIFTATAPAGGSPLTGTITGVGFANVPFVLTRQ